MQKLYKEYKESLKDLAVEEAVDLFIFRPIAFLLVKCIYRLPITPNQLSVLSMIVGISAGVFYAFGDQRSFTYGAGLYALSHVLDCMDGMVARLKKNGTLLGRIIDGWADYITSIAVYIGLLIGLFNGHFNLPVSSPWLLMIPSAFALALHCGVVDYNRHQFLAHALGKANPIHEDFETFSKRLEYLIKEKHHYLEMLLITFYLGYTKVQLKENGDQKHYNQQEYYNANKLLLILWNWIGAASHIAVLITATLLYNPMIYFYYILGIANLWMLVMWIIQVRTNKSISLETAQKT